MSRKKDGMPRSVKALKAQRCICKKDTPLRVYLGDDGKRHGMRCPVVNQRGER